jgi:hypothetical protein
LIMIGVEEYKRMTSELSIYYQGLKGPSGINGPRHYGPLTGDADARFAEFDCKWVNEFG